MCVRPFERMSVCIFKIDEQPERERISAWSPPPASRGGTYTGVYHTRTDSDRLDLLLFSRQRPSQRVHRCLSSTVRSPGRVAGRGRTRRDEHDRAPGQAEVRERDLDRRQEREEVDVEVGLDGLLLSPEAAGVSLFSPSGSFEGGGKGGGTYDVDVCQSTERIEHPRVEHDRIEPSEPLYGLPDSSH